MLKPKQSDIESLWCTTGAVVPSGLRRSFHSERSIDAPEVIPSGSAVNEWTGTMLFREPELDTEFVEFAD